MRENKASSLATRKFEYEDIVNADPRCPPAALKIVRAYLPFINNFEKDEVYRSNIDLQVDTGLSNRHIIDTRNKLVDLGYFEPSGKTATGAIKYRLRLKRENVVLDHKIIAREKLRQMEAERKEQQRRKRLRVSEESSRPREPVPCRKFTDVSEVSSRNYLEERLEGYLYEQRDPIKVGSVSSGDALPNGYALARGDDPHLPYPPPESPEEIEAMASELRQLNLSAPVVGYFRRKYVAGELTPAMIDEQRRLAR